MPSLYNCRHDGDQFRITKFDSDFNPEASYICDAVNCECPAGVRPTCRHRHMLPKFIARNAVGTNWFLDFDRGGWVQGWKEEPSQIESTNPVAESVVESSGAVTPTVGNEDVGSSPYASPSSATGPSLAPAGLGQPNDLEANLSASDVELAAQAQPLNLRQSLPTTIRRRV